MNSRGADFLIAKNGKVIPIEVESGSISSKHISLDRFISKFRKITDAAYVIHSKDLRSDEIITYIPIYMTMLI